MRVEWRARARADLRGLADYIAENGPAAAERMRQRIQDRTASLADHPEIGRGGRIPGTRELVISGTPYIVAYRVGKDLITVLRVIHGAQRWPRRM